MLSGVLAARVLALSVSIAIIFALTPWCKHDHICIVRYINTRENPFDTRAGDSVQGAVLAAAFRSGPSRGLAPPTRPLNIMAPEFSSLEEARGRIITVAADLFHRQGIVVTRPAEVIMCCSTGSTPSLRAKTPRSRM